MRYICLLTVGAPFEPTLRRKLGTLVNIAQAKDGDKVVDIGSGDGRIVIFFAQTGFEAYGIKINPLLVLYSRWKIRKAGLEDRAFIHWNSFWKINFNSYDIIILFQYKNIMSALQEKFEKELKSGSKIISNVWQFPSWEHKVEHDKLFLYEKS